MILLSLSPAPSHVNFAGSNQRFTSACEHRGTHIPSTSRRRLASVTGSAPFQESGPAPATAGGCGHLPTSSSQTTLGTFSWPLRMDLWDPRVIPSNSLSGRSFEEWEKPLGTELEKLSSTGRHFLFSDPQHPFAHKNINSTDPFAHVPSC